MDLEAWPEGVFALCKLLSVSDQQNMMTEKVKGLLEPDLLEDSEKSGKYFSSYLSAAKELNLIKEEDDRSVTLLISPETAMNKDKLVQLMIKNISKYPNGNFYKFTKAFFDQDLKMAMMDHYKLTNREFLENTFGKAGLSELSKKETEARSWVYWAKFIGLIVFYVEQNAFIALPNPTHFLKNLIREKNFPLNTLIDSDEFFNKLNPEAGIILSKDNYKAKTLNYGMSLALYILKETGFLDWKYRKDSLGYWIIHPEILSDHNEEDKISEIIIRGDVDE